MAHAMTKDAVLKLQADLNTLGAVPALVVDGIFGQATRRAVIQFQAVAGLATDGDPGPLTLGAIADRLAGGPVPPSKKRMRVILVRGKLGEIYSRGMDTLAVRLNKRAGVVASVDNYGLFYSNSDDIADALQGALSNGYSSVACIGHSMGADTVMKVGWLMLGAGFKLDLAVAVDPTPFGCPSVPRNVVQAIGYYNTLAFQLGGYRIVPADDFRGKIETHALAIRHIETDDYRAVHDRVDSAVAQILAT